MYPRNAASPPRIAIGAVVQISDGAVQTSGCTVRVLEQGGTEGDGAGTTAYSTDGIVLYTPTQAETDQAAFILIAKKTGCIPVSQTIVTSASAVAGYAGLDWATINAPTTTQNLSGTSTKAVEPTVAGRTLDISAGGEAGIDWANVGTPGSTVALSATTVATVTTTTTATNLTNERGKYAMGSVWIGPSVNTNTVSYTDGIITNPVSTIAAAKTIADALGMRRFEVIRTGSIQISAALAGYRVAGLGWSGNTSGGSQDVGTSAFVGGNITAGTFASTTGTINWQDCEFSTGVTVGVSNMIGCRFLGAMTLSTAGNYDFVDCASIVAGTGAPEFTVPAGLVNVSFRRWSGGITISGITSGTTVSIDVVSGGTVTLNGADGNVQVRGMCTGITDNRTGTPTLGQNAALNRTTLATPTNITAGTITTVSGNVNGSVGSVTGAVGSVTGSVGSVTGNVGGNVVGSVGSVTAAITLPSIPAGWITAAGIATDAIDADALAADAITEIWAGSTAPAASAIADAVWDETQSGHTSAGTFGLYLDAKVSEAGGSSLTVGDIADAVWDEAISGHLTAGSTGNALNAAGSAGDPWSTPLPGAYGSGTAGKILGDNLNATVSSRATQTSVDTIDAIVDDILIDTAVIGAAGAGLSAIPWNAAWDAEVQSEAADALAAYDPPTHAELTSGLAAADDAVLAVLGTPAGASLAADVAAVKGQTAAIETDTQDVQARLPAALVSGRMDASVGAMAANVMTAAAAAADLTTELQAGLATASELATVAGYIDSEVAAILAAVDTEVAAIRAKTDNLPAAPAATGDIPTASAIADAVLDEAVEGSVTLRESVRLANAALGGKASGLDTTNPRFRDLADTKDRIDATVDASGNRSAVTRDLT